jgi:Glyoxalase-like domain
MRIDHVILGARRIEPVRDLLRERHGFGVIQGSAHPDGTQGWLVPFDTPLVQYLEILTAGNETRLAETDFGRQFLDRTAAGPAFLNWAVLSEDIDSDAQRLKSLARTDPGLLRGESVRADGGVSPWTEVGFELSWRQPWRPFFLQYGNPRARGNRLAGDLAHADHATTPLAYARIRVGAHADTLAAWLGPHNLPVHTAVGASGVVESVTIATGVGDIEMTLP